MTYSHPISLDVFVDETLKPGLVNHHYALAGGHFEKREVHVHGFDLDFICHLWQFEDEETYLAGCIPTTILIKL
jgi:hypothetical protein